MYTHIIVRPSQESLVTDINEGTPRPLYPTPYGKPNAMNQAGLVILKDEGVEKGVRHALATYNKVPARVECTPLDKRNQKEYSAFMALDAAKTTLISEQSAGREFVETASHIFEYEAHQCYVLPRKCKYNMREYTEKMFAVQKRFFLKAVIPQIFSGMAYLHRVKLFHGGLSANSK
ncbi:hypothetical protein BDF19DRAFT_291499 [Syncephalis fuscata]|nr:hypothetical protein BDF19DRAFT_291499 [Syncephalis fuscata]